MKKKSIFSIDSAEIKDGKWKRTDIITWEDLKAKTSLRDICEMLNTLGVIKIYVYYEGSGDSGCWEDIMIDTKDNKDIYYYEAGQHIEIFNGVAAESLRAFFDNIGHMATDLIEGDWYNNDGGYGDIWIDCVELKVSIDAKFRYTDVTHENQKVEL